MRVAQSQLLGHMQTQGTELGENLEFLAADHQHQIAGLGLDTCGDGLKLVGCEELVDRRLDIALFVETYPYEALGSDLRALDILREGVDLLAGISGTARGGESGDILRIVEDRERVSVCQIGHVVQFHAETQVGFVRSWNMYFAQRSNTSSISSCSTNDISQSIWVNSG